MINVHCIWHPVWKVSPLIEAPGAGGRQVELRTCHTAPSGCEQGSGTEEQEQKEESSVSDVASLFSGAVTISRQQQQQQRTEDALLSGAHSPVSSSPRSPWRSFINAQGCMCPSCSPGRSWCWILTRRCETRTCVSRPGAERTAAES